MTEWNALEYARISALQEAMAEEVLLLLDLKGTKRVLDVGLRECPLDFRCMRAVAPEEAADPLLALIIGGASKDGVSPMCL